MNFDERISQNKPGVASHIDSTGFGADVAADSGWSRVWPGLVRMATRSRQPRDQRTNIPPGQAQGRARSRGSTEVNRGQTVAYPECDRRLDQGWLPQASSVQSDPGVKIWSDRR